LPFIGNRAGIFFYFPKHTRASPGRGEERESEKQASPIPGENGCSPSVISRKGKGKKRKQKIKPINVMGISRRFAFSPPLCFLAMSLRFRLSQLGEGLA
jgi:hypothetical protein